MSGNTTFGLYLSQALINVRAANVHHHTRYIKKKTFCVTPTGATINVQPAKAIFSFGKRSKLSTFNKNFFQLK